jgi:hypothetical protein
MTHSFKSRKVSEDELSVKYEFVLESGEPDVGLLRTVFSEYIEEPILMRSHAGQSFIMIGNSPLIDKMMNYSIEEDFDNNKILFSITSQLIKNKIVDSVARENNVIHMKLPDGTMLKLKNATDRSIPQIFYILTLLDILDGMIVEVDINDYYPNCKNCALRMGNLQAYLKLADSLLQDSVREKTGCVLNFQCYDVEKKIVECGSFIRNKNPDIEELFASVSIIPELENL